MLRMVLVLIFVGILWVTVGRDPRLVERQKQRASQGKPAHSVVGDPQPQVAVDIQGVIEEARAAPPEFAADALIRIAQSTKITDQDQKRELLEEAFHVASGAQHEMARSAASGGVVDTRSGYLANAFRHQLDALSLRCRAVRALLSVDKQMARTLFSQIPKPSPKPLTCEDALVYDLSSFYATLHQVLKEGFSQKDIAEGRVAELLEPYVRGITSPVEVGPVAEAILAVDLPPSQLNLLVQTLSMALKKLPPDDRSFSYSLARYPVVQIVDQLALTCKEKGISNDELLEAFRTYLVNQLSSSRCADTKMEMRSETALPAVVEYFNTALMGKAFPGQKKMWLISPDEIKPSKIGGSAKIEPYWRSSKAKDLLTRLQKLRFNPKAREYTLGEKKEPDWQRGLIELMNDLEAWSAREEKSEADYFHQKCVLLTRLLELLPADDSMREGILSSFVAFLSDSPTYRESRIEWFQHVHDLIRWARSRQDTERVKVLKLLRDSGNSVLVLYAHLEELIPERQ
ncbi:MAG TPA: hypothetical protein VNM72_06610 [Blastocatellia bacterium]|nr:hypothetical protein [Blastocatellia bacterium]